MSKKRRCLWPSGCITLLSMYNPLNFCQPHQAAQVQKNLASENLKEPIITEQTENKRSVAIAVKEKPAHLTVGKEEELTASTIITAICQSCAISPEELFGRCRKTRFLIPRQIAIYLIRCDLKKTLRETAGIVRRKNPSDAFSSWKRIQKLIKENQDFRDEIKKIRAYYLPRPG